MTFRHLILTGALALVAPSIALAQPAPHHTVNQEIEVEGDVSVGDDGGVTIHQNRSNGFLVKGEAWARHLQSAEGERVTAKLRVTKPGPFGGEVEVLDLVREVRGEVQLPAGGGPMITMNRSNVFQVSSGPWKQHLLQRVGEVVAARVRVVTPGMFGGEVEVLSTTSDVSGEVQLPAGGAPVIAVNRSNLLQVRDGPLRAVVAAAVGRRVSARVRLVEPGMFGGVVEVVSLQAPLHKRIIVRGRPSTAAMMIRRIPAGKSVTIVGATARFFELEPLQGQRYYVLRTDVTIGEEIVGLVDAIPQ